MANYHSVCKMVVKKKKKTNNGKKSHKEREQGQQLPKLLK